MDVLRTIAADSEESRMRTLLRARPLGLPDARSNLGLTNLNDAEDAGEVSVKSRGWSFMLGLGMPIG
jgi:hypothetical protein